MMTKRIINYNELFLPVADVILPNTQNFSTRIRHRILCVIDL